MRVYISVDMEGCAGIVDVDQTRHTGQDYPIGRRLMTDETNAAALGAFDAGADEVLINDSHGDMRNLLFDRLDPRVQVISGSLKPYSMVQDSKADAALFVGYHAGAGALAGVLDHTYYGAAVGEIRVNDRALNEAGLNALVCGANGTPVALVTGDERCCVEVRELLGSVETVTVKWGISRYAARSLHPEEACRKIRQGAAQAVKDRAKYKPFSMDPPYRLAIRFHNAGMADCAEIMPRVVRENGTTIGYEAKDVQELFRAMLAMVRLGGQGIPQVRK